MDAELERLRKKAENYPSPSVYSRLAQRLHELGELNEADRICQRCIKEFPRSGQAYVVHALIMLKRGAHEDALKILETALSQDPRNFNAHEMLAEHYQEHGQHAMAVAHLKHMCALRPQDQALQERLNKVSNHTRRISAPEPAQVTSTAAETGREQTRKHPTDVVDLTAGFSSGLTSILNRSEESQEEEDSQEPLAELCEVSGVNGAIIFNSSGATLIAHGIDAHMEDALGALAQEVNASAQACINANGQNQWHSWSLQAGEGQAIAYRNNHLTLIALTAAKVKTAFVELKARKALMELGV